MTENKLPPELRFNRLRPCIELSNCDFDDFGDRISYISKQEHEAILKEKDERIEKLERALKRISATDTSTTEPHIIWLQSWRHLAKKIAEEALK